MGKRKKRRNYVPIYGDLSPANPCYAELVYERVLRGCVYIGGKRKNVKTFPNGFWNEDTAYQLIRYFVLEKMKWKRIDLCQRLTKKVLDENRLAGAAKVFGCSTYTIVSKCFPEWDIKAWELISCPNQYWYNIDNCVEACVWACQREGIASNKEKFCKEFSTKLLIRNGIQKAKTMPGGLYQLAKLSFPEWDIKPWEMRKIGNVTEEMAIDAVRWMIEDVLHWTKEDVCAKISVRVFKEHGIEKIIAKICKHSPFEALQLAYPGEYERDMLNKNPFEK